ncbi:NgoFVII family restriction endonuclease, partial [Bacillus licheniformis]
LLKKLINELNMYEAEEISINDRRVVNTTVIRDINGTTKIDGYPLDNYPITVKVIGKNADKLYSRMNASSLQDLFAGENLDLQIKRPEKQIKIKAYEGSMQVAPLKPLEKSKGENS